MLNFRQIRDEFMGVHCMGYNEATSSFSCKFGSGIIAIEIYIFIVPNYNDIGSMSFRTLQR